MKKKLESYDWMDDKVELLLPVTLGYKVNKCPENIDWMSCQSKHNHIYTHINNSCRVQAEVMYQGFPKAPS